MIRDYNNREKFPLLQECHEELFAGPSVERNLVIYESVVTGSASVAELAREYGLTSQRVSALVARVAERLTKRKRKTNRKEKPNARLSTLPRALKIGRAPAAKEA